MKDNQYYENAQLKRNLTKNDLNPEWTYFDEEEPIEDETVDPVSVARVIISTIIQASGGNTVKLQAIMAVFAGMSLRESGEVCGRSHEFVRLQINSLKEPYPELYEVLVDKKRFQVTSLVPIGKSKKWKVENEHTGKSLYLDNLFQYCKDNDLDYHRIIHRIRCNDGKYEHLTFTKNY